ncbi:bifunctional tetrahydrofolate synthase/dihydrofolate synthase [Alkalimarinus coralli]|uniref:bifunctional tetrahydrofolate synthase/dihydrofolate synthase n=1 Tax=Alkalimarinus coralli TaxID=2935863 RepID=UPI00202B6C73|nr:bifunctional tetrahydrofolate synthase/dihydrofolate synthase [Alkalimarinus coralli]
MGESYKESLNAWLERIEKNHPSEIEMGLERTLSVYSTLGIERIASQVVVVAGTNGKGSTIAALERLLLDAGKTVGVYSSPHITSYNERVRVNGVQIDDRRLVESFEKVECARGRTPLTYFEFGTLSAISCLESEKLDVVLLEVGLGGRLDAVNIVDADLAIITSVDIDHTEWLGDNRESIGYEKAGIFRKNTPAIYGEDNPPSSVVQQALAKDVPLYIYQQDFGLSRASDTPEPFNWLFQSGVSDDNSRLEAYISNCDGGVNRIKMPRSLLPESNILTAIQAMVCLGFRVDHDRLKGLDGFSVAGRFEVYASDPLVLLDVGHNPHAARFLSRRLADIKSQRPVYAVFSALSDKDVCGIVEGIDGLIDEWFIAPLSFSRAMNLSDISNALVQCGQHYTESAEIKEAFHYAVNAAKENDGIVICFGSFHVVSDIKLLDH